MINVTFYLYKRITTITKLQTMDFILFPFIFIGLIIFLSSFFTVKQQTVVVVERFGKFQSLKILVLQLKIPVVDRIAGRVNLRIQQLDVIIETKLKITYSLK